LLLADLVSRTEIAAVCTAVAAAQSCLPLPAISLALEAPTDNMQNNREAGGQAGATTCPLTNPRGRPDDALINRL